VKGVSSWGAGTRIAVGVVLLLGGGSVNQQYAAQPPGSSPGFLPRLTLDLIFVFAVVLLVSGVAKWWHQRRGPSKGAVRPGDGPLRDAKTSDFRVRNPVVAALADAPLNDVLGVTF
jgi:hypothetical protein